MTASKNKETSSNTCELGTLNSCLFGDTPVTHHLLKRMGFDFIKNQNVLKNWNDHDKSFLSTPLSVMEYGQIMTVKASTLLANLAGNA